MVDSRCAMTMEVRRFSTTSSPSWISVSVSGSTLAVASSRMKIDGSLQQHARQRDQLPLAHREAAAALADLGFQAVRQAVDPVAAADLLRRPTHFLVRRVWLAVADVIAHRAVEQERRLRDDAQVRAVVAQVQRADVTARRSGCCRPGTRRSARSAWPMLDLPDPVCPTSASVSPALDRQREVVEHRLVLVVAEVHVLEADLAARPAAAGAFPVWTTFGSASISAKTRSPAASPKLELAPERGDAGQREPEHAQCPG